MGSNPQVTAAFNRKQMDRGGFFAINGSSVAVGGTLGSPIPPSARITPPVGLNVFIINSVIGKDAPVHIIFRGVMNFLAMDLIVFALIVLFPALSLFLPNS